MSDWIVRNILSYAARLSSHGRLLREDELRKLDKDTLTALWRTLQDADQAIAREKRTIRPWPGGPSIRT